LEEGDGWTCLRCGNLVKRCRPWRGGLKGLTTVGDWGEEVVDRRRVGFGENGPDSGPEIDTEDLETTASDDDDGEGTERADEEVSDIGSEDTERPNRGRPGFKEKHIAGLWAEETLDESVYNTAEGEDE
jgi:peroxin-2